MAESKRLPLKLLVDGSSQKVLFAEAGKDAVDFLFSLLQLPLGTVAKLLSTKHMVGSMGSVYDSVEKLDEGFFLQPKENRSTLLGPMKAPPPPATLLISSPELLLLPTPTVLYYTCKNFFNHDYGYSYNEGYTAACGYVADKYGVPCPSCKKEMAGKLRYVEAAGAEINGGAAAKGDGGGGSKGFVKEVVTYTVMDDLTVTPMSTISSVTMLTKFGIKDLSTLREKRVQLGLEEGLALLRASLQSTTVLTDVFLKKK